MRLEVRQVGALAGVHRPGGGPCMYGFSQYQAEQWFSPVPPDFAIQYCCSAGESIGLPQIPGSGAAETVLVLKYPAASRAPAAAIVIFLISRHL